MGRAAEDGTMPTNRFSHASWFALLLLFSFSLAGAAANSSAGGASLATVVRTIAYHQITTVTTPDVPSAPTEVTATAAGQAAFDCVAPAI